MKEIILVGVSMVCWFIHNLKEKKIDKVLTLLMNFIDQIGCACGQASLLMYPEFVLKKRVEMLLDVKQLRGGLLFNICAKHFVR